MHSNESRIVSAAAAKHANCRPKKSKSQHSNAQAGSNKRHKIETRIKPKRSPVKHTIAPHARGISATADVASIEQLAAEEGECEGYWEVIAV